MKRMQTLTLNDGAVLENSYAFLVGDLYVYIGNSITIKEVFDLLIDPEKTANIYYSVGDDTTTFSGYTRLIAVRDEDNGQITAVLRK